MRIKEVVRRHRNDFSFIAACACGHEFTRHDGYADEMFCLRVMPSQHCPKCGKNEYGQSANAGASKSVPSLSPTLDRRASPQESLPESNNQSETP